MALKLPSFDSFKEGSLLRRTLLYVGTMVLGSLAFIAVTSFVLVSIAKGVVPQHSGGESTGEATAEDGETATPTTGKISPSRGGKTRRKTAPVAAP